MPWFYANAGQQVGPVNDADFERLTREGVIQPTTLVWREGMANWQPFAAVVQPSRPPTMPTAEMPPGKQVICTECRKTFPVEETVALGGATLCPACKPTYVQKLREGTVTLTPVLTTTATRYAGFWIRVAAKIIDSLIIGIPVMLIYFLSAFAFGASIRTGAAAPPDLMALLSSLGLQLLAQFIGVVLGGFYNVFFVVKYGATPGKMAVRLRVVMADGGRLSVGRAIGRYFAEMVSGIACYVGYILVAFDDEKRSLHDRICHTRVIYK